MIRSVLLLVVAVALAGQCEGYARGAPEGACEALEPVGHTGARRNPTPNPYSLRAPLKAKAGQVVTVTLTGVPFKGYMIQAVTKNGKIIGQFQDGNSINCGQPQNTATHSESSAPLNNATISWQAPEGKGQVYFRGTVVKNYRNYYINIYSNPLVLG